MTNIFARQGERLRAQAKAAANREALIKFAANDLRKACKTGTILISQTKHGLVELTYNAVERFYTVTSQDGGTFQKHGTRKDMAVILAEEIYVVVNG